jgi:hypothetical protein
MYLCLPVPNFSPSSPCSGIKSGTVKQAHAQSRCLLIAHDTPSELQSSIDKCFDAESGKYEEYFDFINLDVSKDLRTTTTDEAHTHGKARFVINTTSVVPGSQRICWVDVLDLRYDDMQ